MKKLAPLTILLVLIASTFVALSAAFVIPEGRQAVITQFGKPIRTITSPGLSWKLPFIQDVRRIDLRVLSWDGFPNQIPTKDKKYIEVDTTARWKITDPLKFIQTVQDERGAKSRLDAILDGVTRDVISGHNLVEAVRNSNAIFDVIEEKKKAVKQLDEAEGVADLVAKIEEAEEVTGEIEKVSIGREQLSRLIIEAARAELSPLGIELIDVQLKRISYEDSVQQKVYTRMISERQRIAERIRSVGKGEQAKIEGKTDRDLKSIESKAYRQVQEIKGEAEAKAIEIYAKSLGQDAQFYRFIRTLEVYENSLPKDSQLLLTTKSRLMQILAE
jgi:modulator of FtsH protease HflC